MNGFAYTRYELLRTFRNRRFMVFSLIFPLVMFLLIAGGNKDEQLGGVSLPQYFMAGMMSWGTMMAMMSAGARISVERQAGWHRQLRITPLSTVAYLRAKVISGYAMAALTIVVIAVAATMLDVRLPASRWVLMIGEMFVGLLPFAALGIMFGHLLHPDALGPAIGGVAALLGLLGGVWNPLAQHGFMHLVGVSLPSYWLVEAGRAAISGSWPVRGWLIVAAWTAALAVLATLAYRRDTARA